MKKYFIAFLQCIGSNYFLPVGCILGIWVAFSCLSAFTVQDISQGNELPFNAYIMVQPSQEAAPVSVPLRELDEYRTQHPDAVFLLPAASGQTDERSTLSSWTYTVKSFTHDEQLVQVNYSDTDYGSQTLYIAREKGIAPLSFKVTKAPLIWVLACFIGLAAAVVFKGVARLSLRWLHKPKPVAELA